MAKINIPYLVIKAGRRLPDGTRQDRHYWQPSNKLRALGWVPERLSDDLEQAIARAKELNDQLAAWRQGADSGPAEVVEVAGSVKPNSVAHVIRLYKASPWHKKLKPKTQREYGYCLNVIEKWAGDKPVRAVTRRAVLAFYSGLHETAPAWANANLRVLRRLLRHAYDLGMVTQNVAEKPGMIGTAPRLRIWTPAEIAAAVAAADAIGWPSIGDAVFLALYTGQRQGDLLALKVMQYQDGRITLRQSKRRARVSVIAHPRLAVRLAEAAERRRQVAPGCKHVLACESTGRAWGSHHFRHTFAQVRAVAVDPRRHDNQHQVRNLKPCPSLATAQFMDLRDTAVTNLALAGNTIPGICAISGHSERAAGDILKHYLDLTGEMADAAIAKLVEYEEAQKEKQKQEAKGE